jgi:glycosyltransferase involved in cell wall biosynthesis
MKIIIDLRKYDGVVGGVEQGALQQTRYLAGHGHDALVVCKKTRLDELRGLLPASEHLSFFPVDVATHAISEENERIDSVVLPELAMREGADLIHFYYNWSFPTHKTVPTLLTVHDVIPFTFREAMPKEIHEKRYCPSMKRACALNDMIGTVSEFSRQDIAAKVGVPLEKIRVVPNGLREPADPGQEVVDELADRFGLHEGYFLNVGGIHERKNIPRLIEAFAEVVRRTEYPGVLLITGKVSGAPYQEEMRAVCDAAVEHHGLQERVVFSGFVTEDELDALLRRARMLVYPSLYEGFGIPILEAMKVGTPVVTSTASAMPEVAGDAALLVDPLNTGALADAMCRLLDDLALCGELIRKGKQRAEPFTWDHACAAYVDIYRELAGKNETT